MGAAGSISPPWRPDRFTTVDHLPDLAVHELAGLGRGHRHWLGATVGDEFAQFWRLQRFHRLRVELALTMAGGVRRRRSSPPSPAPQPGTPSSRTVGTCRSWGTRFAVVTASSDGLAGLDQRHGGGHGIRPSAGSGYQEVRRAGPLPFVGNMHDEHRRSAPPEHLGGQVLAADAGAGIAVLARGRLGLGDQFMQGLEARLRRGQEDQRAPRTPEIGAKSWRGS